MKQIPEFKKTVLVFCILFSAFTTLHAQLPSFRWADDMGGNLDENGKGIALDDSLNVYTTGHFEGTVDFDPGAGVADLVSPNGFDYDIFISKMDSAGNLMWAKSVGGLSDDYGYSIAVDEFHNVYVTGYYQGLADFDPGAGVFNLSAVRYADEFILKLDPQGNFIWAKSVGGGSDDIGFTIALDAADNLYTSGLFGDTVDFNPGPGTHIVQAVGSNDFFILKMDSAGNFIWAKTVGGISSDVAYGMTLDANGNIFTTGNFTAVVDFDPGPATNNLTAISGANAFILKLDSAGNYVWAKGMRGTNYQYGLAIAVDAADNVYTAGQFLGTGDFDPGPAVSNLVSAGSTDIYISKLDASGNYVWAERFGGIQYDGANAITADAFGNIYTTGYFSDTIDFDPGTGVAALSSHGNSDIFIAKYDAGNGNYLWAYNIGEAGDDAGYGIAISNSGNAFTTGEFVGLADFNPNTGIDTLFGNSEDIFVTKTSEGVPTSVITENNFNHKPEIYPNPTSGSFFVSFPFPANNTSIEVYNCLGELIYQQNFTKELNTIDLTDYANGLYMVKVITGEQIIETEKIVKQGL